MAPSTQSVTGYGMYGQGSPPSPDEILASTQLPIQRKQVVPSTLNSMTLRLKYRTSVFYLCAGAGSLPGKVTAVRAAGYRKTYKKLSLYYYYRVIYHVIIFRFDDVSENIGSRYL
jgi:hypothetical protein